MSKLSVKKFFDFTKKNNFDVCGIYTINKIIRFFELKTPYTRKTFFVHISPDYILHDNDINENVSLTRFDMTQKNYDCSDDFLKYVNSDLVDDFDLVSITSTMLCHIVSMNKNISFYTFKLNDGDSESVSSSQSSKSSRSVTQTQTQEIDNLLKETGFKDSDIDDDDDTHSDEHVEQTPVTIELDNAENEELIHKSALKEHDISSIKLRPMMMSIPPHLESQQIRTGLVYYCCDMSHFISNISIIEIEVEKCWKNSIALINETWAKNIAKIKTDIDALQHNLIDRVQKYIDRYNTTHDNIRKLSALYVKLSMTKDANTEYLERSKNTLNDIELSIISARNDVENEFAKISALFKELENK